MKKQTLAVIDGEFTIHAFDPNSAIPAPVLNSDLFFIGKTEDTLSVVVPSSVNLVSLESDKGWRALELLGPLELSMVGIMANLGTVLAKAKVSMFIVSTFSFEEVPVWTLKARVAKPRCVGHWKKELRFQHTSMPVSDVAADS